jgi:hypothetical protein
MEYLSYKKVFQTISHLCKIRVSYSITLLGVALGGLVVSVLAIGPKVRVFKPDRGQWIYNGDKHP